MTTESTIEKLKAKQSRIAEQIKKEQEKAREKRMNEIQKLLKKHGLENAEIGVIDAILELAKSSSVHPESTKQIDEIGGGSFITLAQGFAPNDR